MDTNFKYEVMRYIEQCNKNPFNTSGIKKRYNLMHLQLSRDTAQDISICLKGCGTCVCNPIPNHELRFLRSLKHNSLQLLIHASCTTFYERTLSPPLRHHSQSGDIWHALAISMDLNPTGFQLTWRNPILYGAPHCITLHTFPSDTAALRTVTGHMGNKHCFSRLVTNGAVCTVRSR